ncbi:MAG: hypothetical protein COU09_02050 [Candidatus Harrisonbacteria bacterium CG10_big_fil_rev_8_21_14_0_10_44_23]|uniref:Periplasmic heavy metal sensor n=1 Tax=Candidatus Harrisonbacteria bacterium CG10_big_fil_rev_8_21_14_0_10_44_23 TaxID=1974585 RepID=A0A2H0UPX4_9BACT|nr:MAG: hypothetical protein COU09_02050 [Candidatus Harrisonbacteria bacterium CG10_big_fil_rev_8_21_14_0_10_44_23]
MKNKVLVIGLTSALALASVAGAAQAFGGPEGLRDERPQEVIRSLADRFDLDESQLQDFFELMREKHQAQMEERQQERLDQAVDGGLITEEQRQLLEDRHEAQKVQMDEIMQIEDPEERRAAIEAHHDDMRAWMEENEIDLGLGEGRFGMGASMGGGMHRAEGRRGFGQ